MGIAVHSVAVRSSNKDAVLAVLGLEETGDTIPASKLPRRSGWAVAVTPEGWTYITGDFWRPEDWNLKAASCLGLLITSSFEEHVMVSDAAAFQDGAEVWFVARDPEKGPQDDFRHLEMRGNLPPAFAEIYERFSSAQDQDDDDVDHLIEIPVELAKSVCGLRPDFMLDGDGLDLVFRVLRRNPESLRAARAASAVARRPPKSKPATRVHSAKPTTPFWPRFVSGVRRGWATYRRARAESRARFASRDDD